MVTYRGIHLVKPFHPFHPAQYATENGRRILRRMDAMVDSYFLTITEVSFLNHK